MPSGPSQAVEAMVAVFVPPACREEVLGDLYERYRSLGQYTIDALRTVPLVILSRIRRTADPQVLLMQSFALYVSFLCAAWLMGGALLRAQWGLLRLALPVLVAMLGLVLEDAYAKPGFRSRLSLVRGPVLGLALALVSQGMLRVSNPEMTIPLWIALYGSAMSLLLSSGVRMLFPPTSDQLMGVNAPAHWLKQSGGSIGNLETSIRFVKGITVLLVVLLVGLAMTEGVPFPKARAVPVIVALMVAYLLSKRG